MTRPQEHIPTAMPTDNRPRNRQASLNDDTSRLDAVSKVTGRAKYGRDVYLPRSLFVGFVRCPYGSAELEAIDVEAAKEVPGVIEVTMTDEEGTYHGQTVGYIVAESKPALQRSMRAAAPRWKRREVKTTIADGAGEPPAIEDAVREALDAGRSRARGDVLDAGADAFGARDARCRRRSPR